MTYRLILTPEAQADLNRLFDFVLQRELGREDGDLARAGQVIESIKDALQTLRKTPFTCRKSHLSPFLRELIIAHGRTGYVALFDIMDATTVAVIAVRHQLEDDYH